jgi:hypothetical protein
MAQFAIPDSVKPIAQYLASLTPQRRSEINQAISTIPPNHDPMDIALRLAEIVKIDPNVALGLIQFYLGLFQNIHNYGIEKVLSDFQQAIENEYPAVWNGFFKEVKPLLESELFKTAYLFARAESIQSASDHAFLTASMITSLIPFQVSENQLSAALSYELKITFSHGSGQDFFAVTLSEKDIEFLKLILEKAQEFGLSITNLVKEKKFDMLTHSEII